MRWLLVITIGLVLGAIAAAFAVALQAAVDYMRVIA